METLENFFQLQEIVNYPGGEKIEAAFVKK